MDPRKGERGCRGAEDSGDGAQSDRGAAGGEARPLEDLKEVGFLCNGDSNLTSVLTVGAGTLF